MALFDNDRERRAVDPGPPGAQPAPQPQPVPTTEAEAPAGAPRARRRGLLALGAAVVIGLAGYGGYEAFFAGATEATDDAYVAGDVVAITAREAGTVIAINADNTEAVKRGQTLLELDPATADANMAAAEAQLASAVRGVRSGFAGVDQASAQVASAAAELARARDDLGRRQAAAREGAVSGEEVAHAADTVRTAAAALQLAQSQRRAAQSSVQGTSLSTNPEVLAAIAAVRRAGIALSHMKIVAPVDGVIAQRTVQLGQQVQAGAPLMAVVPLERVWVDANFRETQLADIRIGQPVTLKSDVYGGDVTYHGRVLGLGAGSGNAFALLPPQNASGNWIKITQRVPVRIALDGRELQANPLRIGLSVKATVNTQDHSGPPVARAAAGTYAEQRSIDGGPQVDALIARIIAENRGGVK